MNECPETIECPVHLCSLRDPEAIALRDDTSSLTYRELESRINERVTGLRSSGIRRGDRIAILSANSIEFAIWIYALYRVGAIAMPLNLRQSPGWWKRALVRAGCRLVIADHERWDRAKGLGFPAQPVTSSKGRSDPLPVTVPDRDETFHTICEDLETTIIFTSGSMGRPRGVILTFGNHLASALGSNANLPLADGDCWLAVLPFYHVGGMAILMRSALAGSAVFIQETFDPCRINELIDQSRISHLSLVPTMLDRLIEERGPRPYPRSLKSILLGGGAVPVRLIEKIEKLSIPVVTTYGMTETASQVTTLSPHDSESKRRSSGKPLSRCEVDIVDEKGQPVERGETGEIRVRGKSLFKGYLGSENRSVVDSEGWFRTGDVGHLDEDGYLYVTGRIDDMFVSGGENIYPWMIEEKAMEVPGVVECAVVPVEDRKWGQRPVLFVEVRDKDYPGRDELGVRLEKRLPSIMVPDRIFEIDKFPRTALGKIDRAALRGLKLPMASHGESSKRKENNTT